jgi:hypothetical protein
MPPSVSEQINQAFACITEESLTSTNPRFAEAAKTIIEWRHMAFVAQLAMCHAPRENSRITSRDIFGLPGSATREYAIAKLKAKENGTIASVTCVVAKSMSKKDKKAKEI